MNKKYALGIDIGGSHLAVAIVDIVQRKIISNTKVRVAIDTKQDANTILNGMVDCISGCLKKFDRPITGIGVSVPGPFDYEKGISKIYNCNKYDSLFGMDLKIGLWQPLQQWIDSPSKIVFMNDAFAFLAGEAWSKGVKGDHIAAITLGTGVGSGFMINGEVITNNQNIPKRGQVFNLPFKGKRAEDWLGSDWFLTRYKEVFGNNAANVKMIAEMASSSEEAKQIFEEFGANLGDFLAPILNDFKADHLIFGGNITKSFGLFESAFEERLNGNLPKIMIAENAEDSAILGAVQKLASVVNTGPSTKRVTDQYLMPPHIDESAKDSYDVFPDFQLSSGSIDIGYRSLAQEISKYKSVMIDGYLGVYWEDFITSLTIELKAIGVKSVAFSTHAAFKDPDKIDQMIAPYLGGDDPVFGKVYSGDLDDFFDRQKLDNIDKVPGSLNILFGPGAGMTNWGGKIVYIDVPKNEIQYRSRSGNILNLGAELVVEPKKQYKRMFFVDWQVLNKHKQEILTKIDYIVDGQYLDTITWASGDSLRKGLKEMSKNAFRAKPWFEPGVWGGHWMKEKFKGLSPDVVNYAWSFELIVPENGVVFSNNGIRLEVSFDMLMFFDNKAILGDAAETFGTDFPIRFDYLDTFDGDKLSLQCHPTSEYINENFSEKFTQDETYYILDAAPDAEVYLGFKEGVKKKEFHKILVESNENMEAINVEDYIQIHPARKHDLFLIPNGTIHCSGKNNLVLEISSTPYIYTFKMYDWMRMDLDGNPRPLNIERGMQNVNFDCQGEKVVDEYISKESVIDQGVDWKTLRLSTHQKHFYEVFRFEFQKEMKVETKGQCHILNLVEGERIQVNTGGRSIIIQFAETFVIPSATEHYTMINLGHSEAKVILSNVKPEFCDTRF